MLPGPLALPRLRSGVPMLARIPDPGPEPPALRGAGVKMVEIHPSELATLRTALRYLVSRAGGHVVFTAEQYREAVPEGKHFHVTHGRGKVELFVVDAEGCAFDLDIPESEGVIQ